MRARSADSAWDSVSAAYADAIRAYAAEQGNDPDSPAFAATVRTNTDLVPGRARSLLEMLAQTTGIRSLEGRRVLDLGTGWGSLATYFALTESPGRVVAVDKRPDFIAAAAHCSRTAGIESIEYVQGDAVDLPLPSSAFDVLIANNALIYLVTGAELQRGLAELYRVAAPSAAVVIHQANRWQWRDPFTRDPLVHLLPPRNAASLARRKGWTTSHDRARVVSPMEMRRRLRSAGFDAVKLSDVRTHFFTAGARKANG